MKKMLQNSLAILCLLMATMQSHAQQLNVGDLAFVGFNADGSDDWAMVTFVPIAPNTVVYFTDNEWDGTAWNTGESSFTWNSGSTVIPAGAIIQFDSISVVATLSANYGTITGTAGSNFGLAAGGDALFCYQGTDINTPTRFIAAITNGVASANWTSLTNTGLAEGTTAIVLTPAGVDIAAYTGPRTGLNRAGYITAINNIANWVTQDGSGDQHNDGINPDVPFSNTPFTFSTTDNVPPTAVSAAITTQSTLTVLMSEAVTTASAQATGNYVFTPAVNVQSVSYNNATLTATLTVANLTVGQKYQLSVNGLIDVANNTQTVANIFDNLYFNNYAGTDLVLTEIMYNAAANADSLEFLEFYNKGTQPIALGGLRLSEGVFGTLPQQMLAPQGFALIAQDTAAFRRFYGIGASARWSSDLLSNGGERITLVNSLNGFIDSVNYDDVAPWPLEADGQGPSLEIINVNNDNGVASNWRASVTPTGRAFGAVNILASPGRLPINAPTVLGDIGFAVRTAQVSEAATTYNVAVTLRNPSGSAVAARLVVDARSQANRPSDFTLPASDTIRFTGDTATAARTFNYAITINNDAVVEGDEYLILSLVTIPNGNANIVAADAQHIVFIQDNDEAAIRPNGDLNISYLTSYRNGASGSNSAEIVGYEKNSKRLFIVNSIAGKIDIINFSNPAVPVLIRSIAAAGINSIAIKDGIIVAALENPSNKTLPGTVVFLDTAGTTIKTLTVGVLPDMVAISPNGRYVVTANEAEPMPDYLTDPEGSVTIVDISGGVAALTQANVRTVSFTPLNTLKNTLRAQRVRLFGRFRGSNDSTTVAQDLEPEYVTFSPNSATAYVALQENNALIVIDLASATIGSTFGIGGVFPLGYKDHSQGANSLDASDQGGVINMTSWRVNGLYQPDGIATLVTNGTHYIMSANEGDLRDYTTPSEEARVVDLRLDSARFTDQTALKINTMLGRLKASNLTGDTDNDGDIDEINTFGGRSFSIWDPTTGALVWDSGNQFERITRDSAFFNVTNDAIPLTRKNRSDDKGTEPEGITTATINGKVYAFIGLERTGGLMTYNVTNPLAPVFVSYLNPNRKGLATDDLGPEGVIYIPAAESPNGRGLILLANEISSTVTVFQIEAGVSTQEAVPQVADFNVYPNPATGSELFLSRAVSGRLVDISGKIVQEFTAATTLDVSALPNGIYFVMSREGAGVRKVMIAK